MGLKVMQMDEIQAEKRVVKEPAVTSDIPREVIEAAVNKVKGIDSRYEFMEKAKDIIILKLAKEPRFPFTPVLLSLFTEIMLFRLYGKKNKAGILKATVNQITMAIELTPEDVDGWDNIQM